MALSANTVLEVRGGVGSDTNGGGFVTGSSGTDWSQQASPQYSVADGVTALTTTITSATANFGTDVVGNLIYVQGGTGAITAGWYQIVSRTNSTTIVVDRSTGLTAGTGVTLKIGGCFATIGAALALMTVSGMTCYVKSSAVYSISSGLTWPAGATYGATTTRLIGYTTTRGDNGRATVKATAAITGFTNSISGTLIQNFEFDGNSTGTIGLSITAVTASGLQNIWAHHWTAEGINMSGGNLFYAINCEVSNCGGTTGSFVSIGNSTFIDCYSHNNTKSGFYFWQGIMKSCVSANNTGASSDGYTINYNPGIVDCIAYNNGRHGIFSNNFQLMCAINCLLVGNAGFGLHGNWSGTFYAPSINYNAYYNNTSGARGGGLVAGANDVTLTGDPFTNAASGNFSLNSTAGAGQACRSSGFPGVGLAGTGYDDIGAYRHQDPAASTNIYPIFD